MKEKDIIKRSLDRNTPDLLSLSAQDVLDRRSGRAAFVKSRSWIFSGAAVIAASVILVTVFVFNRSSDRIQTDPASSQSDPAAALVTSEVTQYYTVTFDVSVDNDSAAFLSRITTLPVELYIDGELCVTSVKDFQKTILLEKGTHSIAFSYDYQSDERYSSNSEKRYYIELTEDISKDNTVIAYRVTRGKTMDDGSAKQMELTYRDIK